MLFIILLPIVAKELPAEEAKYQAICLKIKDAKS
jgi:hypothetical protein